MFLLIQNNLGLSSSVGSEWAHLQLVMRNGEERKEELISYHFIFQIEVKGKKTKKNIGESVERKRK
jgi:hypothetical protein